MLHCLKPPQHKRDEPPLLSRRITGLATYQLMGQEPRRTFSFGQAGRRIGAGQCDNIHLHHRCGREKWTGMPQKVGVFLKTRTKCLRTGRGYYRTIVLRMYP